MAKPSAITSVDGKKVPMATKITKAGRKFFMFNSLMLSFAKILDTNASITYPDEFLQIHQDYNIR